MPSISPVYARLIARELSRRGLDTVTLFAGTGLDPVTLWQESEIQLDPFLRLIKNAERINLGLSLGFLIGEHQALAALGSLGVALGVAPTLRDGLRVLESFTRLQASYTQIELRTGLRGMSIRVSFLAELGESLQVHAEVTAMLLQTYVESVSGQRLNDAVYRFTYSEPLRAQDYRVHLHSPCRFGQREIALELPKCWLDNRSPYFHAELWGQSLRQLSQRLRELGDKEVAVYSRHIRSLLRSYDPPLPVLADIAEKLHMSERTLNRRLQQEDTSFREIRGRVLIDWAQQYLVQGNDTIESIATALGYQDAANFRRAFRSRVGLTPIAYRHQNNASKH
jgi:AraC-like DNA-binding protein